MPSSMTVASGRAAKDRKRREINILEAALDRLEALWAAVREDVDHRIAGDQAGRDDLILGFIVFELGPADGLLPDPSSRRLDAVGRLALVLQPDVVENSHSRAAICD